jgi:hypothetical protein
MHLADMSAIVQAKLTMDDMHWEQRQYRLLLLLSHYLSSDPFMHATCEEAK